VQDAEESKRFPSCLHGHNSRSIQAKRNGMAVPFRSATSPLTPQSPSIDAMTTIRVKPGTLFTFGSFWQWLKLDLPFVEQTYTNSQQTGLPD
jgi:hypothetical protein